jgi:hypothetical protein
VASRKSFLYSSIFPAILSPTLDLISIYIALMII